MVSRLSPSLHNACVRCARTASNRYRESVQAAADTTTSTTFAGATLLTQPLWLPRVWEGLGRATGEDPAPPHQAGRLVMDGFATAGECGVALAALRVAIAAGAEERHGDASLALDVLLRSAPAPDETPLLDGAALACVAALVERMQKRVMATFGLREGDLRVAGVLASRLSPPSAGKDNGARGGWLSWLESGKKRGSENEAEDEVAGYWNPHVDKANRCAYDYSSILYLTSHGLDFEGGRFAFLDETVAEEGRVGARGIEDAVQRTTVTPGVGRFVCFTSGLENVHHVERVSSGQRVTLSAWFTQGDGSLDAVPTHAN